MIFPPVRLCRRRPIFLVCMLSCSFLLCVVAFFLVFSWSFVPLQEGILSSAAFNRQARESRRRPILEVGLLIPY